MKILLLIVFFPIVFIGQNIDITNYVERINDTCQSLTEEVMEGPLINRFSKNGKWKIYFVNDAKQKKSPIRICFLTNESDKNTELKLFYNDEKLLFAELTIIFTSGKSKNEVPFKRQYFLPENESQWQTENTIEEFKEIEKRYSFKYLFSQDKLVRKMVKKKNSL